jgi:hypothetical protein
MICKTKIAISDYIYVLSREIAACIVTNRMKKDDY